MGTRKPQSSAVLHVEGTAAFGMLADNMKDLKNDMNRNFDLLLNGQKKIWEEFQLHCKEDDKNFADIKTVAAEGKGEAKAKVEAAARKNGLWMLGVTALAGVPGIAELLRWLHK